MKNYFASMKDFFLTLISGTQGRGPSSTRLVYLVNGLAAVFCALMMTIGGILVYCVADRANGVYWSSVAALWTATLGFGSKAKSEQQKASKEIALAPPRGQMATAMSGD
jgi:uncharacterized membrane protein